MMDLPLLAIGYQTHPNIADNIFAPQMEGASKVLTYDGTNPMLRRAAMSFIAWNSTLSGPIMYNVKGAVASHF
jgi:hypothetical protein